MAMYTAVFSNKSQMDAENEVKANVKKKCFEQKIAEDDLCPFKLQWSFGINAETPIINLTTKNRTLLAYACSHVTIIYDYGSRKALSLQGHRSFVRTLSTTRDGKWLLTADFEDDCAVVVWNIDKSIPVCTLFHPHGNEGMTAARISPDAKQIVTVGNEKCQNVYFWLWTYGKDIPDASISLIDTASERVKEIVFNDEHPKAFALTTDYNVLFLMWDGSALNYDHPKVMAKIRRIGIFNGSCFAPKVQQAFTATTNGYILVWTDISRENEQAINKTRKHLKTVDLQNYNITVIITHKDMLVIGSSNGRVTFYDYELKLLYWCQSCKLDSIRWISFTLDDILMFTDTSEIYDENDEKTKLGTSKLDINVEYIPQDYNKSMDKLTRKEATKYPPTDATLQSFPFNVQNFLACSPTGVIALIEISRQKCNVVLHYPTTIKTSIDIHPESNCIIVGDAQGSLYLYDYEERILIVSRNTPPLPNFEPILERQASNGNIIYISCPCNHEYLKAVTALKFSPKCDMLVCGLENGTIWILHHITLEVLDEIPYKHSYEAINKIAFARCGEYMAYVDNALTVVVFKRNGNTSAMEHNIWNLLGKYHSHYLFIRDIFFDSDASNHEASRLYTLGEDQEIIEYDLLHSGPYPEPGLKILRINRIEQTAVPFCIRWYSQDNTEKFFVTANSEYKYKIFDENMTIRGTYLGPIFGEPVQQFQILTSNEFMNYMVFATNREIGLQLLPLDGNPYKIVGMTGHPEKIIDISVNNNGQTMFTIGYNDPCVLIWSIRHRSVDIMAQLGGEGLSPFYDLIEGGKKGWLINEMKDLFYYAQILHQGENTTAARIVSDTIVVEQISNLMRAIGYFPTNAEIDNIITEVSYKHYVKTGELINEITFEEFVRLYVNHRPAIRFSVRQIKEVFCALIPSKEHYIMEDPILTREQFIDILLGQEIGVLKEDHKLLGEPMNIQDAYMYLKLLLPDKKPIEDLISFDFMPIKISYKDFIVDIMGVELSEETRLDD